MKTKGVLGKRIVEIRQRKGFNPRVGKVENWVEAIVLEGGITLLPLVNEWDDEYQVDFHVRRSGRDSGAL